MEGFGQMLKVTLSTFTNPAHGRRVHQVMLPGHPITRELDDLETAERVAQDTFLNHFGKAQLWTWDGDACAETLLAEHS